MVDFPAGHVCSPPSPSYWRRAHAVRLPTHLGRVEGHHWRTRWRTRSHPVLLGQTPTINFSQQKEHNLHELSWAIVLERLCLILGCRHFPSHFSWMLAVAIWIWWYWPLVAKRVQDGAGGFLDFFGSGLGFLLAFFPGTICLVFAPVWN